MFPFQTRVFRLGIRDDRTFADAERAAGPRRAGLGAATLNASRQAGGALGVALPGSAMVQRSTTDVSAADLPHLRLPVILAAVGYLIAVVITITAIGGPGRPANGANPNRRVDSGSARSAQACGPVLAASSSTPLAAGTPWTGTDREGRQYIVDCYADADPALSEERWVREYLPQPLDSSDSPVLLFLYRETNSL